MKTKILALLTCCLLTSVACAQPKAVYEPQGAPANPKVPMRWNLFHDYQESTDLLKKLAATFPEQCRLQSLGTTYGKREMWLLTITNFQQGEADQKPAYWIDGGIHANEIQATEVALYTAWYLLETHGRSEFVRNLLRDRVFYIVPMMSPDSRDAHFYEANNTHSPRSGQRPIDDDKDGLIDEDKPDDLNGDGHITQMRVRDPNGRWKAHADYPQLMIQAKDGEKGEYRLLGSEGFDNDGDGQVNEDSDGYYDPNRDWPIGWQPSYVQPGAYRYPFSIHENRVVADFINAHPNIGGAQSYHNAGGMILRGPGAKGQDYEGADVQVYTKLGKQGEKLLPGYRLMHTGNDLYEVFGGEVDYWHEARGAFAFTNELFTPFNYFRNSEQHGFFGSDETQLLFSKYLLFDQGLAPWKEVDHP
ncbi:MAG TPA: M14 family metallopeptidase, partial [Pirellulaceae bacterium]|nr:M14 family metallopeptidase [Pirellulaceae bacterium]